MGSSNGMKNRDLLPDLIFKIDNTAAAREFLAEVMEEPSYKIKGNPCLHYIGLCGKRYGYPDPYPSYSKVEPNRHYKLEELKGIYRSKRCKRNRETQGISTEEHGILQEVFDPSTINSTNKTKETPMNTLDKYKNINFATPVLFRGECIKDYTKEDYMRKLRLLDSEIRSYDDLKGTAAIDDIVSELKVDRTRLAGYFNLHMESLKVN